jgi:hypothetical protein
MNMQASFRHLEPATASRGVRGDFAKVVLADGTVVTARLADEPHGKGVRCRVLAPDGATERFEFLIESEFIDFSQNPRLTALAGGGFRLGWIEATPSGPRIECEEFRPSSI